MKIETVSRLSPMARLVYWIKERQRISIRKAEGQPKPWTDDEILQSYRFCNVRRIDDKVSQWLYKNWYEPRRSHPNMLLACTLARQLNNIESLEAVGYPATWNPDRVQEILEERAGRGLKNYSSAYMITANFGTRGREPETKAYQTVWRVCDPVHKSKLTIDTNSMMRTWRSLLGFQGFSSFIAGQVVADLRWAVKGSWKDKDTWAPMGPGSERGLNRILGRPVDTPLTQQKFLDELLVIYDAIKDRLGIPMMELMDLQNCCCELDKYERVRLGEGRPKNKYKGV